MSLHVCCRQDEPWFEEESTIVAGEIVLVPHGEWCFKCGTVLECFPRKPKSKVAAKVATDASFQVQFKNIRNSVAAAITTFKRRESVSLQHSVVQSLRLERAFIPREIFDAYFPHTLEGSGYKVVTMKNPELKELEGIVLWRDFKFLYKCIPHYVLDSTYTCETQYKTLLLKPEQILREGQPKDRYLFEVDRASSKKQQQLRMNQLTTLPSFEKVWNDMKNKEKASSIKEQERQTQQKAADEGNGGVVQPKTNKKAEGRSGSDLHGFGDLDGGSDSSKCGEDKGKRRGGRQGAKVGKNRPGITKATARRKPPSTGAPASATTGRQPKNKATLGDSLFAKRVVHVGAKVSTAVDKDTVWLVPSGKLCTKSILRGWSAGRSIRGVAWLDSHMCVPCKSDFRICVHAVDITKSIFVISLGQWMHVQVTLNILS
jgi:hypothetical protein